MNIALPAVLCLAAGFWAGWEWRDRSADLSISRLENQEAEVVISQNDKAREIEQSVVRDMADIGEKHEQNRNAAATIPDSITADLRAGNLRLRQGWAGCETQRLSDFASTAGQRNASADSGEEFAGAIVRVGKEADDQLLSCQAVVESYQHHINSATIPPVK